MSKIKQKYLAFRTAQRNFNKRKINLHNAFCEVLNELAKNKNIKGFISVADEMIDILGEEYSITKTSIAVLHGIHSEIIKQAPSPTG